MERGDSMIRRSPSLGLVTLLCLWSATATAERTAVLVTNSRCPVSELSSLEIRKAYLGVAVSHDGYAVRPLRLTSDPDLNRVFFQAIVAMSEKSYERRALSLALKFGTPRPEEFASREGALAALERVDCGLLYLWANDVEHFENTKVIKALWRGD